MKTFMAPSVDVKKFDICDVLTTSAEVSTEEEETPPPLGGNVGQFCAG